MSDLAQEIKTKIDFADFLRSYIKLSPAGKNLKAICPFHKEKTPSFMVSPERQMWHCFGACNEGGDIFKFLMKYENIEFVEALKILAEKAGVEIRRFGTSDQKRYNLLYEINNSVKEFFKSNLAKSEFARNYLKERGLKPETVEEFEIGLASAERDALMRYLLNAGYAVEEISQAGLSIKTERGTYWDRFRSRIMFPICNHFGKVAAFTGRILPNASGPEFADGLAAAKYLNSPETPIFNKSKIIYGFYKSKNAIRDSRCAVLVEGQMDFLMLWQDGVQNIAAASGTALTADHLNILKHSADNLTLIFDSDEAGQAATERAIDLAGEHDFSVKIAVIESRPPMSWKDPADVVKEKPGLMAEFIAKAAPAMEYYLEKYQISKIKNQKLGIAEIKKNLRLILSKIKRLYSPVERAHWLKEVEKRTGVAERYLMEELEMRNEKSEIRNEQSEIRNENRQSRKEIIADRLFVLATAKPEFFEELKNYGQFIPPGFAWDDPLIALRAGLSIETDERKIKKEFQDLVRQLKLEYWKERRKNAVQTIQNAEQNKDETALAKAMREFDNINKEIQSI
jgi:DNA primase